MLLLAEGTGPFQQRGKWEQLFVINEVGVRLCVCKVLDLKPKKYISQLEMVVINIKHF